MNSSRRMAKTPPCRTRADGVPGGCAYFRCRPTADSISAGRLALFRHTHIKQDSPLKFEHEVATGTGFVLMGCAATVLGARAAALKEPMRIGHVDTNISAPAIVGYMRLLMCSRATRCSSRTRLKYLCLCSSCPDAQSVAYHGEHTGVGWHTAAILLGKRN